MKNTGDSPVNKAILIAHFVEYTDCPPPRINTNQPPQEPSNSPPPVPAFFAFSVIGDQYYICGKTEAGFGDILTTAQVLLDVDTEEKDTTSESGPSIINHVAIVDLTGYHRSQ